jgi:outer membrane protein
MRRESALPAMLLAMLLVSAPAMAAGPTLLGYVDVQQVFDKSKLGQQAQATIKEKFGDKQKAFAEEEQAIRQMQQTLARDQALMSQSELDKKKAEIQKRVQAFQQKAARVQQQLAQEQSRLTGEIMGPTQEVIAALAKEKKLSAVFERRQSGLLYIEDSLDLTPEVIKRLNSRSKK